jgi:hypothetical protein
VQVDNRILARMRELSIYQRAGLISSYTRFDNGQIDELHINRDIQTLTAFIDATGEGLPDDICRECLCQTYGPGDVGGHNWGCSKNPPDSYKARPPLMKKKRKRR